MAMVTGRSGPGYAEASIPPWLAAAGGGGAAAGGGAGFTGDLGGMADLVRQAMLQKMDQSSRGFDLWTRGAESKLASAAQARDLASAEEGRRVRGEKQEYTAKKRRSAKEARLEGETAPARRTALANATARDTAETQAVTGRTPTRMSTVGMQTFATPDALKMTGAQRKAHLAGGAGLQGGPSRMDLSGVGSDLAWDAMIGAGRERQRQAYGEGRG